MGNSGCAADANWDETRLDECLSLLADKYRRDVLRYFRTRDITVVSLDELVAGRVETETAPEEEAELILHHETLPKLAENGVVEYDPRSRTVVYRDDTILEQLLASITDTGNPNRW